MATRRKPVKAPPGAPQHDHSVLVLQGGGALGAYQAGVYEGMAEQGFAPDWVTGVSIGAINAALISGNPPAKRVARLREFWELVSSGVPLVTPAFLDPMRMAFNRISASATMAFGVPGFFTPRVPPPFLQPDGTPEALSVYDTAPLRDTLRRLVNFDLINEKNDAKVRLSVGVSNVHSGNSEYFDNRDRIIGPEHIMASGALPPGFPPVEVDGSYYWDGGIVSNSPLWYVLDDSPNINALIVQVDLFSAKGELPTTLDQVLERAKDIQYSSKTRFNTNRVKEIEGLRVALGRLLAKVPAKMHRDVDYELLAPFAQYKRNITIMHLINRRLDQASSAKDYEFSRGTMQMHWQTGLEDVRRTCAHPNWLNATEVVDGVRTFDLAE
ncbi:MAG TPA: patatin-like phospholipase family protein [Casimicrobiaceae bacterium]